MQIIPSLNSGGVEQGTLDLANYIADIEMKNLVVSNGGRMLPYLKKDHVVHYKLPVHSKNFFKMPFVANQINSIIKENRVNIVHVRSRAPAWLMTYINKDNLKTVSTFHNVYGRENFLKKIYNKKLANSDFIVAISKYVSEEIIKNYQIDPSKITVINRGIDTEFYNSDVSQGSTSIFLKRNHIPTNKKIILYPGRLTKWKGQLEFLNIIEKFKNEPYLFYFVGDDKNIKFTKELISQIKKRNLSNSCKILGHLKKEDLKIIYHCSDLVISMPLKADGFGRVISETLSMKKMLIAYNIGGVKNQLENLDDIYKVNSRDPFELINKIQMILKKPSSDFDFIKQNARDQVIKNFSKKQMLKKYVNLYQSILP